MALKCVVLGDIHGLPSGETCFLRDCGHPLAIQRMHLAELLGVEAEGEALHRQLVENGGFDASAAKARDIFRNADLALGYSAGGTILWDSVLLGLELKRLICISSTRLRDRTPGDMPVSTLAIFGDLDPYRPPASWGVGSGVQVCLLEKADHAFYLSPDANWMRCRQRVLDFIRPVEIPA